jgi:hypothetical protein
MEVASLLVGEGDAAVYGGDGGYTALLRNKGFVLLLLSYGCLMGVNNSVSTLINVILVPSFGGDAGAAASTIGFTLIVAGVPGALLIGMLLGHKPRYHQTFRVLIATATLAMTGFAAAIQTAGDISILAVAAAGCVPFPGSLPTILCAILPFPHFPDTMIACRLGLTLAALMSTGFEFGAELTWPVSAEKASALL